MATSDSSFQLDRSLADGGPFLNKPARTMLLVIVFAVAPLMAPPLQQKLALKGQSYEEMLPHARDLIAFNQSLPTPDLAGAPAAESLASVSVKPASQICSDQLIDDPEFTMDRFNASLVRSEAKAPGAITRIAHYGDSPITNDGITGTVRQLLQERFGDSGHGFILVDRPWDWYGHQGINFSSSGNWTNSTIMNPRTRDGEFGFGAVAAFANGPGKSAEFGPVTEGKNGRKFTRMDVFYLQQPDGGQFSVSANSKSETVSTAGDATRSGFYQLTAAEGNGVFGIKSVSGEVRIFGAVLENDDPGVVYDSLGVNGAFAGLLATAMNGPHWTEQLQHRNPNLVILNYGTNESEYASDEQIERYDRELREVISRVRTALPSASILIISPMDRGKRAAGGRVITLPSIPKIVEMQRRVALESHCAFLNLFAAMGGEGTMGRWHEGRKHLVGGDLTHPNAEGAQTVGTIIYTALVENYNSYRERLSHESLKKTHDDPTQTNTTRKGN